MCTHTFGLTDFYTHKVSLCGYSTKTDGWRGWGPATAIPSVAGRSAVAQQRRAVQVNAKTSCGIAGLCINGAVSCCCCIRAKRAISPSAAVSQQGLLFIYCQIGYLQHHPVVPYLRPLAPAVRLPVSPRKTAARPTSCTVLCCLYCSSLAITLAILTPIRQPKYLYAAPGDDRRSAYIRVTAAPLRSLLLTDLMCWRPPPCSQTTHTHNFGYTNSHTAT